MPYDDPHPDDPNVLVGVELPATHEAVEEMAWAVAEELAAMGMSRERILHLFETPFYAAAYQAFEQLGREKIESVVDETLAFFQGMRFTVRDAPMPGSGLVTLGRLAVSKED